MRLSTVYFTINGRDAEAIVPFSKLFQIHKELSLMQKELAHIFQEDKVIKGSILN